MQKVDTADNYKDPDPVRGFSSHGLQIHEERPPELVGRSSAEAGLLRVQRDRRPGAVMALTENSEDLLVKQRLKLHHDEQRELKKHSGADWWPHWGHI